jgi:hypothetical protein
MPRPTAAELTVQCRESALREGALREALNLMVNDKPAAVERVRIAVGERYELRLYGPQRAHGGVVVTVHYVKGQRAYVDADYLDALARRWRGHHPVGGAFERLAVTRDRIVNGVTTPKT